MTAHLFLKKSSMISLNSGCHYVLLPQGPKLFQNTELYLTGGLKINISAK